MPKTLDLVVPVLNEENGLSEGISRLHQFLSAHMTEYEWKIVIADNGSTDSTPKIGRKLSEVYAQVDYIRLEQRGRGRALSHAWSLSKAYIVGYMDIDLSTSLCSIPPLVKAIHKEGYDIAIGSRLLKESEVIGRSLKREFISRGYSIIFRSLFFTSFRDAQCGFKAISRKVSREVVPQVKDTGWFFDSELLILSGKNGYNIKEIPVHWTDDRDTKVKIVGTAWKNFIGLIRLRFGGLKKASKRISENRVQCGRPNICNK